MVWYKEGAAIWLWYKENERPPQLPGAVDSPVSRSKPEEERVGREREREREREVNTRTMRSRHCSTPADNRTTTHTIHETSGAHRCRLKSTPPLPAPLSRLLLRAGCDFTSRISLMPIPDLAEAWMASVQSSPIVASTCCMKSGDA